MYNTVLRLVRPLAVATGLCLIVTLASGQITIGRADIPETIGDSFVYKYTTSQATISVGLPGGPQTWDFDTSTYVGALTNMVVADIASTPFQAEFPTANLVHRGAAPGSSDYSLVFQELNDDAMVRLGQGSVSSETATCIVYDPAMLANPLPLHYEDEWPASFGAISGGGPIRIVAFTWGTPKADAWGTVTTPAGTFECLRVNSYDTTISETYMNDTLFHTDTSGYRTMYWVAPHRGVVVFATGEVDDTSMVFTETNCYRVMVAAATGIAESHPTVENRANLGVTPNPVAGRATFSLAAVGPGPVAVRLHDRTGRLVRELRGVANARGECRMTWDGRDRTGNRVTPGVYFGSTLAAPRPVKFIVAE